jgi:metallophosphoesterase superfamily enzyme
LHYPFHDPQYIGLITKLIKKIQPDGVVQLGDFVDFHQISSYDKDPSRSGDIVEDLRLYAAQLDVWEQALPPGAEWRQLEGNHEDRLRRYVWRQAPELHKAIKSVPEILRFPERNKRGRCSYRWFGISNWKSCRIGDVALFHGHFFNEHTAAKMLGRYRTKAIQGHTHRYQVVSDGHLWAVTLGHGSNEAETAHSPVPPCWQQALGVLTVDSQGRGHFEGCLVERGATVFRGEVVCSR